MDVLKAVIFTLRKGDPDAADAAPNGGSGGGGSSGGGGGLAVLSPTLLLARALVLLERQQGLAPQLVAVVDVSSSPEHRFWVSNQTGVAYPRYPQIYIGDRRVGSLRDLEEGKGSWRASRVGSKNADCTVQLAGMTCPAPSAAMAELGVVQHWTLGGEWRAAHATEIAAELSGLENAAAQQQQQQQQSASARQQQQQQQQPSEAALDASDTDLANAVLPPDLSLVPGSRLTQLLFAAALQGRDDVIARLAGRIAADITDSDGRTPLQLASLRGHAAAVKALIAAGASVAAAEGALNVACSAGHTEVVSILLHAGSRLDTADSKGQTPLHAACGAGSLPTVELVLSAVSQAPAATATATAAAPRSLVDAQDIAGQTSLHIATGHSHADIVRMLLASKARHDLTDRHGRTPLHLACGRASELIVRQLVQAGADVNASDNEGQTPLHLAATAGFLPVVRELLAGKPRLDAADKSGLTPLHIACRQGHADVVGTLVAAGAPVNATDNTGRTPLRMACKERHMAVMDALIAARADVNLPDLFGATPIYVACGEGHTDVVQRLIDAGADIDHSDRHGRSPLYSATVQGHVEVVRQLVQAGADVSHADVSGVTALGAAAQEGNVRAAQLLLKAGANPDLRDMEGWTPLRWACQQGHSLLVETLINAGAEVCLANTWSDSLRLACSFPQAAIVEPLARAICQRCKASPQELDLSSCSMSILPRAIAALEIETLNVENNILDCLPPELGAAPRLRDVLLRGNPLDVVPRQYHTWNKMRPFLQTTCARAAAWREFRLIAVGAEASGKTTLVRCLKVKESKDSCKKRVPTNGVAVTEDLLAAFRDKLGRQACTCNAWDLSGKDVFLQGHQFFLRGNAAFCICHNINDRDTSHIDYWLSQIAAMHAPQQQPSQQDSDSKQQQQQQQQTPVFLVLTHLDLCKASAEDIIRGLRSQYQGRAVVHGVSCKDGKGISDLRNIIVDTAGSILQRSVPPSWVVFYDHIRTHAGTKRVEWNEFVRWAAKCGLTADELPGAVSFLCDTGIIMHFDEGTFRRHRCATTASDQEAGTGANLLHPSPLPVASGASDKQHQSTGFAAAPAASSSSAPATAPSASAGASTTSTATPTATPAVQAAGGIENVVILSPQWLANVLAATLLFRPVHGPPLAALPVNGVVPSDRLADIFAAIGTASLPGGSLSSSSSSSSATDFTPADVPQLVVLMEQFEVLYRLFIGVKEFVLVPSLLPTARPLADVSKLWPTHVPSHLIEHQRLFKFQFFPAGLFPRLAMRLMRIPGAHPELVWGTGLVFSTDRESALVLFDNEGQSISCTVRSVPSETAVCRRQVVRMPRVLLRAIVASVTGLVEHHYPGLVVKQIVSCTHCLHQQPSHIDPAPIPLEECAQAAANGDLLIACPTSTSPVQTVRIDHAAPELPVAARPIPVEELASPEVIGIGMFGRIIKGVYKGVPVAIKEARLASAQQDLVRDFQLDVATFRCLTHRNVVRFFGTAATPPPYVRLVSEFLEHGTLRRWIQQTYRPQQALSSEQQTLNLKLALDVARGMAYLHNIVPPVTHRGLSSFTVYLTQEGHSGWCAKVADASLGRYLDVAPNDLTAGLAGGKDKDSAAAAVASSQMQQSVSVLASGIPSRADESWRWKAPEAADAEAKPFLLASDVFAFAMVLWELLAPPAMPLSEFSTDPRYVRSGRFDLVVSAAVRDGLRPTIPASTPSAAADLIRVCWDTRPTFRPLFPTIVKSLCAILRGEDPSVSPRVRSTSSADIGGATPPSTPLSPSAGSHSPPPPPPLSSSQQPQSPAGSDATSLTQTIRLGATSQTLLPVGERVWVAASDNSIAVFDSRGFEIHRLRAPQSSAQASAPSSASAAEASLSARITATALVGESVWVASEDRTVTVYDRQTFEQRIQMTVPAPVTCLLSPTGLGSGKVWGGTAVGSVIIWSSSTLAIEALFAVSPEGVRNKPVRCLAEHQGLVLVGHSDLVYAFGASTIKQVGAWPPHMGAVTAIISAPPTVWTGSSTGEIRVWDVPMTQQPHPSPSMLASPKYECLRVATGAISHLLAVPAAGQVWSASRHSVVIWDAQEHRPLQEVFCPPSLMHIPQASTPSTATAATATSQVTQVVQPQQQPQNVLSLARVGGFSTWTLCPEGWVYVWRVKLSSASSAALGQQPSAQVPTLQSPPQGIMLASTRAVSTTAIDMPPSAAALSTSPLASTPTMHSSLRTISKTIRGNRT